MIIAVVVVMVGVIVLLFPYLVLPLQLPQALVAEALGGRDLVALLGESHVGVVTTLHLLLIHI